MGPRPIPDDLLAGLLREAYCDSRWPMICSEVKVPGGLSSPKRLAERVVVVQESPDSPLQLHGFVELRIGQEREALAHLSTAAENFDAVWLIQRDWPANGIWEEVTADERIGVLGIRSSDLSAQVLREPTGCQVISIDKKLSTTQRLLASILAGRGEGNRCQ